MDANKKQISVSEFDLCSMIDDASSLEMMLHVMDDMCMELEDENADVDKLTFRLRQVIHASKKVHADLFQNIIKHYNREAA